MGHPAFVRRLTTESQSHRENERWEGHGFGRAFFVGSCLDQVLSAATIELTGDGRYRFEPWWFAGFRSVAGEAMGSRNFDFLTESFLFNDHLLSSDYKSVAERRLAKELRDYRSFCKRHRDELAREVLATRSNLKMFVSDQRAQTLDFLKQTAFYLDQVIFDDPLFSFWHPKSKQQRVLNQFNSFEDQPIDRRELSGIVRTLKGATPMVASGFLKFLPISSLFDPPQQLPMFHSEDRFASTLPPHLMSFCRENSVVRTLTGYGNRFRVEDGLRPCRLIDIRYRDDNFLRGHVEQLFEQRVESIKGDVVTFAMRMPDEPPAEPYFRAWVEQSVNKAAWRTHEQIVEELRIANRLSASYLTTSEFVRKLLHLTSAPVDTRASSPLNVVLNVPLPCLPQVDIVTLMRMRNEESDAFELFRRELDRRLSELRSVLDPEELKGRGEVVIRQFTESEVPKVDKAVKNLRRVLLGKAVAVGGTLVATVQSHGLSLPFLGAALASGYASYAEYRAKVLENPAFFLWTVLRKS